MWHTQWLIQHRDSFSSTSPWHVLSAKSAFGLPLSFLWGNDTNVVNVYLVLPVVSGKTFPRGTLGHCTFGHSLHLQLWLQHYSSHTAINVHFMLALQLLTPVHYFFCDQGLCFQTQNNNNKKSINKQHTFLSLHNGPVQNTTLRNTAASTLRYSTLTEFVLRWPLSLHQYRNLLLQ